MYKSITTKKLTDNYTPFVLSDEAKIEICTQLFPRAEDPWTQERYEMMKIAEFNDRELKRAVQSMKNGSDGIPTETVMELEKAALKTNKGQIRV